MSLVPGLALILTLGSLGASGAATLRPDAIEFFETRVRPVLAEQCYGCHSAAAAKLKGGLLLDSPAGLIKGGESGAVLVPGHPEESRLIEAIGYGNPDLQMPPKSRLRPDQIADLTAWIKMGAPWGSENAPAAPREKKGGFDLERRRESHWAWQPIRPSAPPEVHDAGWPKNPIDRFILAKLEASQLHPARPATAHTLIRRLSLDLIGLPPPPELLDHLTDPMIESDYAALVDQWLRSPAFGERWARHWLDLVRYAETLGHEFDYPNLNAWRYRDYVIRALNTDLLYNQFVTEQIAGDLLSPPRTNPADGSNESVIGTTFYWLGQRDHSPVDVRQHQAEVIDNQIDVLTKAFLGLTVACARCHDHKFDAIPSQDYYALYGILSSSRYDQATIDSPTATEQVVITLQALKTRLRSTVGRTWLGQASLADDYLRAATHLRARSTAAFDSDLDESAEEAALDPLELNRWVTALQALPPTRSTPPQPGDPPFVVFADFTHSSPDTLGWFNHGEAFGPRTMRAGDFIVGHATNPIARVLEQPAVHSALLSRRLEGVLRSPTFVITNRFIHILAAGREARINISVDNFTMIREPIYGALKQVLNREDFHWVTVDASMWIGHRAYLEFSDMTAPDPADDTHPGGYAADGYLAVRQVLFSDKGSAPAEPRFAGLNGFLGALEPMSTPIADAVNAWTVGDQEPLNPMQVALLSWLVEQKFLDSAVSEPARALAADYARTEAMITRPSRIAAMTDGSGLDEPVFFRGNHHTPGEPVHRHFLTAIAGRDQAPIRCGSGRLELARALLDESDPLVARVIVNRIWLHLFGRGIVPTPDDFGVLGQPPSHPELLDWLANWFRTEGHWSIKRLVRLLVTSNTYRMSSRPIDVIAEEKDPDNQLWHRMPIRRLEGEIIRDSILTVSGRLDRTLFGPPVPIHLTEFMDGRGRPSSSGPLDGAGRRSIYLEVRRNFVSPMMRAFDMPVPFTTIGRRSVSNVPAQSLILMNDPFVQGEARHWAKRVLARGEGAEQRIAALYESAFFRPPTKSETAEALVFLKQQAESAGLSGPHPLDAEELWADLCHVLFNVKEFVFVN